MTFCPGRNRRRPESRRGRPASSWAAITHTLSPASAAAPWGQLLPRQPGEDPGGYAPEETRQLLIRAAAVQNLGVTDMTVEELLVEVSNADVGLSTRLA